MQTDSRRLTCEDADGRFRFGSVELAPAMGLAERIVDLVDTGRTLHENGLVEVEEILRASARLVVNRAGLKTRYRAVQELVDALRAETARRMAA